MKRIWLLPATCILFVLGAISGMFLYKKFIRKVEELNMEKVIDLSHKFTKSMPVHSYDDPPSIKKNRNLETNKYNDWQLTSGMHVGTHIDGPGHLTNSHVLISDIAIVI
jgi:hypothetical protein